MKDQSEFFEFKQFKIKQNSASVFKVNTEAVLLSAWAQLENIESILEIGSGTGVISLGLIQRLKTNIPIIAIDIDIDATQLTQENIEINQVENIKAIHSDLKSFAENSSLKFDLIISNPPFFETTLQSTKKQNIKAKYTDSLSFEDLLSYSISLLNPSGKICIVVPDFELKRIESISKFNDIYINRILTVYPHTHKSAYRVLIEISHTKSDIIQEKLTVKNNLGSFTTEYNSMLKDYYLKF